MVYKQLSNSDKKDHGMDAMENLEKILRRLMDKGFIFTLNKNYRVGKSGYSNREQFYAPFLIQFTDSVKWALYSTTSMRTDRLKGNQWDAYNLKELNLKIDKVYMVYPDAIPEKERVLFKKQNEKYLNCEEYSEIDGLVSQTEITELIQEYSNSGKNIGFIKDKIGRDFEDEVADIMSDSKNLEKWKYNSPTLNGMHYDIFLKIVQNLKLEKNVVEEITASTNIPLLPSGGSPKTDVIIKVKDVWDSLKSYTISCKKSNANYVSVHQYKASAFATVLDSTNLELKTLLEEFQRCGNMRDMIDSSVDRLTECLKPYVKKLVSWAISGTDGEGDPEIQWASYILINNTTNNSVSIYSTEEYVELLLEDGNSGNFGTPFRWTYPSKQKGNYIQLKAKIRD